MFWWVKNVRRRNNRIGNNRQLSRTKKRLQHFPLLRITVVISFFLQLSEFCRLLKLKRFSRSFSNFLRHRLFFTSLIFKVMNQINALNQIKQAKSIWIKFAISVLLFFHAGFCAWTHLFTYRFVDKRWFIFSHLWIVLPRWVKVKAVHHSLSLTRFTRFKFNTPIAAATSTFCAWTYHFFPPPSTFFAIYRFVDKPFFSIFFRIPFFSANLFNAK